MKYTLILIFLMSCSPGLINDIGDFFKSEAEILKKMSDEMEEEVHQKPSINLIETKI